MVSPRFRWSEIRPRFVNDGQRWAKMGKDFVAPDSVKHRNQTYLDGFGVRARGFEVVAGPEKTVALVLQVGDCVGKGGKVLGARHDDHGWGARRACEPSVGVGLHRTASFFFQTSFPGGRFPRPAIRSVVCVCVFQEKDRWFNNVSKGLCQDTRVPTPHAIPTPHRRTPPRVTVAMANGAGTWSGNTPSARACHAGPGTLQRASRPTRPWTSERNPKFANPHLTRSRLHVPHVTTLIPRPVAAAPHLASPADALGDSPGDQANFDDTSPAPVDQSQVSPKGAGSPGGWREMAGERPSSPGTGVPTVTPNGDVPGSPNAHHSDHGAVPSTPNGEIVESPGYAPTSPGGPPGGLATPNFANRPPPRSGISGAIAAVTSELNSLAEKARKRNARNTRRNEGGKLLLQQLQDEAGAKDASLLPGVMRKPALDPRYVPPTIATAFSTKVFGSAPPPDPNTGLVPVGDPLGVKASAFYKFKASKRRNKQSAYVASGKARKRPDETFDGLWARVQRQEALLNKIKQDGKRYAKAMAEAAEAARSMAGHIAELADGESAGAEGANPGSGDAQAVAHREQVAARANQLVNMMETLEVDVHPACAEQLRSAVTQPVAQLCEEFPAYKPCVDKRRNYMLDVDAYARKLEYVRGHTKDPGQIPHRVEQHQRATKRFTYFNDKLVEDLTLLDNNRFELAGFLIEGFVETAELENARRRDVYLTMTEGKLPQRG